MGDVVGRAQALEGDAFDQGRLAFGAVGLPLALSGGVGADEAGGDVVDRDAPGAELVGELAGEADLGGLGGGVGLDAGEADAETGATRDIDDAAEAGGLHGGGNGLGEEKSGGDVHVENCLPLLRGDLFERLADLAEHAARVIDQHVYLAARPLRFGDESLDDSAIGHVDAAHLAVTADVVAEPLGFGQLVAEEVAAPDGGAALGKGKGDGAAKAVGCAGDDDSFTAEVNIHGALSILVTSHGVGGIILRQQGCRLGAVLGTVVDDADEAVPEDAATIRLVVLVT